MPREVRWERMFPDELEAAFEACPVAYFTYGLCEPHGPQCAVGLDALKAHGIACKTAQTHGGIVAPPDYWHIHEIGGYALWSHDRVGQPAHSWLTCMPPWQHFKNICYHIRQADTLGFKAAIFLTGHYGPNWQDLKTLCESVQPHVGTRIYSLPDLEANQPGFDGQSGDHAGKVETSLLWALEPDCIDVSRIPPEDDPGPHFAMGDTVRQSNRQIGERMVNDEVEWLGNIARELMDDYDAEKPTQKLRSFEDVERLWDDVVRPEFKNFRTMQANWKEDQTLPEDSVWYPNWEIPDRS